MSAMSIASVPVKGSDPSAAGTVACAAAGAAAAGALPPATFTPATSLPDGGVFPPLTRTPRTSLPDAGGVAAGPSPDAGRFAAAGCSGVVACSTTGFGVSTTVGFGVSPPSGELQPGSAPFMSPFGHSAGVAAPQP